MATTFYITAGLPAIDSLDIAVLSQQGLSEHYPQNGIVTQRYYTGTTWTPSSNVSVSNVILKLKAYADISIYTYVIRIWSLSGTSLNAEITNSPSVGVVGNPSWSDTEVKFAFATPVSLTASTQYAITIDRGSGGSDTTNYITVGCKISSSVYAGDFFTWRNDTKAVYDDGTGYEATIKVNGSFSNSFFITAGLPANDYVAAGGAPTITISETLSFAEALD
jgi:hypothetical protein